MALWGQVKRFHWEVGSLSFSSISRPKMILDVRVQNDKIAHKDKHKERTIFFTWEVWEIQLLRKFHRFMMYFLKYLGLGTSLIDPCLQFSEKRFFFFSFWGMLEHKIVFSMKDSYFKRLFLLPALSLPQGFFCRVGRGAVIVNVCACMCMQKRMNACRHTCT